jgi:hypothetical protein
MVATRTLKKGWLALHYIRMERGFVGVLQSIRMNYSQSVLLYQDKPKYGLLLKLILIIPVILLASSIYLWSTGDAFVSLALLTEAFIIGLILWFVLPREYQVYENHLRIVLGGPFSVKVGFQNIEAIRITSRLSFNVNFATRITKSYVEIAIKKGMSIAITPTDDKSFVEKANLALSQWIKTSAWVEPNRKTTR